MEVTIHPNDFSNLLRCLALLKDNCIDADIIGGVLRQRTDNKANIVEMDLTPLISDCDIAIPNVKSKLPLLRGLAKQEVKIRFADDTISFLGERFTYEFRLPRRDFLENKFISSQELANIFSLREEDVVCEYTINKETFRLMKVISSQFNILSFQMFFEEDTASIIASTTNKDQYARIARGIPFKAPWKGFSNLVTTPFLIDWDGDIFFKMFKVQEDLCINKFRTSIGKISVILYCRTQLLKETYEEEP